MKLDFKSIVGTAVSIGVLYLTVYYIGKGWKRSQSGDKVL